MNSVVTDLLGKRVSVSMWLTKGENSRDASGEMVLLITGIVRAVGVGVDCFLVMVQTEIAHRKTRKVGALTMFSIGPRGGIEIIPVESEVMQRYRELRDQLRHAQQNKAPQDAILRAMQGLWGSLSEDEKNVFTNAP